MFGVLKKIITSTSALNFGAGPAKLPKEVLTEIQTELVCYQNTGMSLMEMSHRSKEYTEINSRVQNSIRQLLNVPANYKILFMQGGGCGAFAAIALNLISRTGKADYAVTGTWSDKAAKEAAKYGKVNLVFPIDDKPGKIPNDLTWNLDPEASYFYYCDNETVDGVEFHKIPETKGVPIVADMSSSIMTKKIDVSKFGCILGGAQMNIGPGNVVFVIIREDLIGNALKVCPSVFDFKHIAKENNIHNTPTTFSLYVMDTVLQWIQKQGGLDEMKTQSDKKSQLLYKVITESNHYYYCPIDPNVRSRKNILFRIGGPTSNKELENKFVEEAEKKHMFELKGHKSVGGICASLYNAVSFKDVQLLVEFMETFKKSNPI